VRALILILLAACGDNLIPSDEACKEQAIEWCMAIGYPSTGCETVYTHWCGPVATRMIETEAQLSCLDSIQADAHPDTIPRSCETTWAIVPPQCFEHCAE
jgi:hypothetical protein